MNMNPFEGSKTSSSLWSLDGFVRRPAPIVLLFCLLLGSVAVLWRTQMRATDARSRARTEALAVSAGIELQLSQTIAAAETLGALAKYNGGL